MYSEKLEKLIEMALLDGELTEKEKQILFRNAEKEGIDLDEFEMVLEGKLFENNKNNQPKIIKPKSDKFGDVKKCPSCGAIVETFSTKCSDCDTEFRNIEASKNIVKFSEKLDEIELSRTESVYNSSDSSKSNIGFGRIILLLFFWPIIIPLEIIKFFINKYKPTKWSTTDTRKEELILNFPIPVSREEILEFLTLATSKINSNTYFNVFSDETRYKEKWNKIWLKKVNQIQTKANLSMKSDKKSLEEVNNLCLNTNSIAKSNNKKVIHILLGFISLVAIFSIWLIISNNLDSSNFQKQKKLKIKAETFIRNKEYLKAEEIILSLDKEIFIVELKSKIQLAELTKKINALELFLNKKQYSKLKLELEKITWSKNSKNYDSESIERESYKIFLKKKEALSNQLPKKYQIEIESEYSL